MLFSSCLMLFLGILLPKHHPTFHLTILIIRVRPDVFFIIIIRLMNDVSMFLAIERDRILRSR